MKKFLLLSALCCAVFSAKAQNSPDVNGDGYLNSADVVAVYNAITNDYYIPLETVFTANGVSFKMVPVKGGEFNMGATPEQENPEKDEKPAHEIQLTSYLIGETEVTQALWEAVMGSNPSYYKGPGKPVENVSWNDCQTFISKLNELTGKKFRLPTEAQWEYAARGGNQSKGYQYSGSNNIDDVAWYKGNTEADSPTHPVKTKQPNELGIYDMTGNVNEWCSDWYLNTWYSTSAWQNPSGPYTGVYRVMRGGGWSEEPNASRTARRYYLNPKGSHAMVGLRLALTE